MVYQTDPTSTSSERNPRDPDGVFEPSGITNSLRQEISAKRAHEQSEHQPESDLSPADTPRLAVLISFSGQGGVERMTLNLLQGFAERGVLVDLLTIRSDAVSLQSLPSSVRVIDLGVKHSALAVPCWQRKIVPSGSPP
jgi:hypothetical protein